MIIVENLALIIVLYLTGEIMCYAASCNPTCGKCRPKRIILAQCEQCGTECSLCREEYLLLFNLPHKANVMEKKIIERGGAVMPHCKTCGEDMTETFRKAVEPLPCSKSQIICGFPCGGRIEPHRDGIPQCPNMVPVGRYVPENAGE